MIKKINKIVLMIIFSLLLIGCDKTHIHEYQEEEFLKTCIEDGYILYTCKCGKQYKDNIVKAGHNYSDWEIVKEATENETGLKERTCLDCKEVFQEEITKLDHVHKYQEQVVPSTCTEQGYTLYICSCDDSYKDKFIKAKGHTEQITKGTPATCTDEGLSDKIVCTVCNETIQDHEVVKAKGHIEEIITGYPATYETTGLTDGIKCTVCDIVIKQQEIIPIKEKVLQNVNVTLNPNGGVWEFKQPETTINVLKQLTLTNFLTYDVNGYKASLNNKHEAIWWNYIVLVKSTQYDAYEVKQIVSKNSNVTINYDYVVMWHSNLEDANTKQELNEMLNNENKYIGKYVMFENIQEAGNCNITMKVVEIKQDNINNNIYGELNVIYKDPADFPIIKRTNFYFKGWLCSVDNKTYDSYPGYYENPGNITYTAQWELKEISDEERIFTTYEELKNYYNSLGQIKENINLITNYGLMNTIISYTSNNKNILSDTGIYTKQYKASKVTFNLNISYGTLAKQYTYEFDVMGYKKLENIASSYVYTNYDKLTNEFFDTMDVIYCAFVLIDINGNFTGLNGLGQSISSTNNRYLGYMKNNVLPQAHKRGDWVVASIGGGGEAYDLAFEEICTSEEKMNNLVKNIINLINTYGFDGVDIDWEIPNDGTKFTKLMKKIYTAVKANNPNHIVTAAIGGGKWQPPKYDLVNSKQFLDYVNLMTYNMVSNNGYHHTALYKSSIYFDKENQVGKTLGSCSIEESVEIYNDNYGIGPEKIIIGAAFYAMKQSKKLNDEGQLVWMSGKTESYTNIKNNYLNNSNYDYFYDTNCQAPYLLSKDRLTFISFDDPRSIKAKCEYLQSIGAAGMMYWQNGQDTTGDLVRAIKEGLNK